MGKIKDNFQKVRRAGFYSVFISGVINKVVNFAYGIVLVRLISKASYGVYAYAFNIYSYFALFLGLGAAGTLLQLCSEDGENIEIKERHQKECFSLSVYFDCILAGLIVVFALIIKPAIAGSNILLLVMGVMPIVAQYLPLYLSALRADFDNRKYSQISILNSLAIFVFSIIGAILFGSFGVILGRYAAEIVTLVLMHCAFRVSVIKPLRIRDFFKTSSIKKIVKLGITICISESLVQVISLLGTSILGTLVKNEEVIASYKVAATIPNALVFIASAIMTYAYPYFAKNRTNYIWTRKAYTVLILCVLGISVIVSVGCIIFAPVLIKVLFGEQYGDCVELFRILMVGYVLNSVLRIPAANLILSQWKMRASMVISICGLVITLVVNALLIRHWGITGAAWAQCLSMGLVGSVCTGYYLFVIIKGD